MSCLVTLFCRACSEPILLVTVQLADSLVLFSSEKLWHHSPSIKCPTVQHCKGIKAFAYYD
uniref:Uncharacterized protein n=1 Tax=Arundo donax TaxID=35708 RepID=A0A0A9C1I4_ARUDO